MLRGCLSACGLAALLGLLPSPAAAQTVYHYPYNYGFTQGHYPYYYSLIYPPPETSVHYRPVYNAIYYPGLGYSLRFEATGATSRLWTAYQGVTPSGPVPEMTAPDNTVTVEVRVPDPDAVVWIDGYKTTQRGTARKFVSPPLAPGKTYRYEIRAEWTQGGRKVEQTQAVTVEAGHRVAVDFLAGTPAK